MLQSFNNSEILIVGGAGFVGSNLANELISSSENFSITIIDNLLSSERENIPLAENVKFIEGSITDDKILCQLTDTFDYIFHLSCYHGNQSSIHDPLADHENNTLTTLKLFNHIKSFKQLKKVVYSAAGCSVAEKTFDTAKATLEEDPISLVQDSPYSISKVIGEFYSVYFHKQHGLPVVRARFQNVYGPGEVLGAGKWRGTPDTVWRNVTPSFIYKSLIGESLPLHNGGDASRDFIFVKDICRGLMACSLRGSSGDVYNLASGIEISIKQLAEKINELTGNTFPVKYLPRRAWDTSGKRFGSNNKARKELDFKIRTNHTEGLKLTIDWFKKNFDFIQKNIDKHSEHMP